MAYSKELVELKSDVAVMKVQISEMHKALVGNGKPGIVEEIAQAKGSIATFKYVASIGGFAGLVAFVKTLF